MPELPEVETTVRGLAHCLEGQTIARVRVMREGLRRPFPADLAQALTGARVTHLTRRAKYGLVHTDRGRVMVFHLGMSGRWRIDPAEADRHDHLVLETGAGRALALNDPRRFGSVDLVDEAGLAAWPAFAALGPEPLGPELSAAHLARALAGRSAAIKLMLLDQRVVAGLGNIYVCEALFRAGIAPTRAAGKVDRAALERLVPEIRAVLDEAIAAGGSTLRDFAQPDGELGYFSKAFEVYGREGQPCTRCANPIGRIVQGGRSTWSCARCQR
ncbi:MAG: bifunctional DNA-formamidopyrimidine glycosylase/DNA-(apurinic or apyrimidinic site) lyase [Proteobacteria bacterium]|nr:bifunctional DNA-formamidopyrimidine glycosylase/DNA-(apurinic or apyrimidinic site) lyase [Pseudomonadota bacterium]